MMRLRSKLGGFNSMRARVQVRSPSPQHNKSYSLGRLNDGVKTVAFSGSENSSGELNFDVNREMLKGETERDDGCGNKVMVVVDSSIEAKGALQWALTHTVQNHDTIILLHVATASKLGRKSSGEVNQRAYEHLCSMKKNLQIKRPLAINIEPRASLPLPDFNANIDHTVVHRLLRLHYRRPPVRTPPFTSLS